MIYSRTPSTHRGVHRSRSNVYGSLSFKLRFISFNNSKYHRQNKALRSLLTSLCDVLGIPSDGCLFCQRKRTRHDRSRRHHIIIFWVGPILSEIALYSPSCLICFPVYFLEYFQLKDNSPKMCALTEFRPAWSKLHCYKTMEPYLQNALYITSGEIQFIFHKFCKQHTKQSVLPVPCLFIL